MIDLTAFLISRFGNNGFFVEAGAHDGIGDSRTYDLEREGWRGICVEPSSAYDGLLESRRPCIKVRQALYDHEGVVSFKEVHGDGIELSGVPDDLKHDKWEMHRAKGSLTKHVPCTTLDKLLEHWKFNIPGGIVHFLCLDTEGSELRIWKAHDPKKFQVLSVLIEHNGVEGYGQEIRERFAIDGYKLQYEDERDYLFLKGENT